MNTVEDTKEEWRELGFHYHRNDKEKFWFITGSKDGLLKFANILDEFANNPRNNKLFEHNHYGPYSYLKIMTVLEEKGFDENAIFGEPKDIVELSNIVKDFAEHGVVGETQYLGDHYSPSSDYDFILKIENDSFDPPSIDEWVIEQDKKN